MKVQNQTTLSAIIFAVLFFSCSNKINDDAELQEKVLSLDLKKGNIILCSPAGAEFGKVDFALSCSKNIQPEFNLAVALLHSFEYEEAEKAFANIIEKDPRCPMAYWGVAMSSFHELWNAPDKDDLDKGLKAVSIARSLPSATEIEKDYINAIAQFYKDHQTLPHNVRKEKYKLAMKSLHNKYPTDKEAAIFYCLALNATADPTDKTYRNQKEAGKILDSIFPGNPLHPGIAHYIIHNYDYPELAHLALPAARKYASIAPSSAHALHMPTHIFTRLGLWDESIQSNKASVAAAVCYAESAGINGHWDEEFHGLDYLVYAYLQKGQDKQAKELVDYVSGITDVYPKSSKVAFAYAAIPSRYLMERKQWKEAAAIQLIPANFPWEKYPWQKANVLFTRMMGLAHVGKIAEAKSELNEMANIQKKLLDQNSKYEANQVAIQRRAGEAWILLKEGNKMKALQLMHEASDMEDKTQKHPVTPGEVIPARELLADMYMETGNYEKALEAYIESLKTHPNRLNGMFGAAISAEQIGNKKLATSYYTAILSVANPPNENNEQVKKAKAFLTKKTN